MHVGENRKSGGRSHARERLETFVQTGAAGSIDIRTIRLVEARLENDSTRHALTHPREMFADAHVECVILQHARSSDQKEPIARKE
jgi:hypothetical protein